MFKRKSAKITPYSKEEEEEEEPSWFRERPPLEMKVARLHTILNRYGGQRRPKIEPYEVFEKRKELMDWRYVPKGSTVIYISHEWTGSSSPDHDGTQMYHLLLLLERLKNGLVPRTEMDAGHVMIYKQNHTTTSSVCKRRFRSDGCERNFISDGS